MKQFSTAAAVAALCAAPAAYAQSVDDSSEAVAGSGEAAAKLSAAGVKTAVGSAAVPLGSAAATTTLAGASAGAVAEGMWESANAPLKVDDEVVLQADPPPNVPRDPYAAEADAAGNEETDKEADE